MLHSLGDQKAWPWGCLTTSLFPRYSEGRLSETHTFLPRLVNTRSLKACQALGQVTSSGNLCQPMLWSRMQSFPSSALRAARFPPGLHSWMAPCCCPKVRSVWGIQK